MPTIIIHFYCDDTNIDYSRCDCLLDAYYDIEDNVVVLDNDDGNGDVNMNDDDCGVGG